MQTIQNLMAAASLASCNTKMKAAGTSEGAQKGWDTRGRGRSVRDATRKFSIWNTLHKIGFKEIGQRLKDVRTFTMTKRTPDGESNYKHRIDIKSDGSWRHGKGPVNTDMAVGRVHGTNLQQLQEHLASGKYQTSFQNQGHRGAWNDVPEMR